MPAGLDATVPRPVPVLLTVRVNLCTLTVRVATLLVTLPAVLLTTTVNCAPLSVLVVGGVV